jgi:3-hydroxybutyryl-CoA dehydrogenase
LRERVAIIGAGPVGRRLALAASRADFQVLLEDVLPQNLHRAKEWLAEEWRATQPDSEESATQGLPGVRFVSTIEEAVREADLAIDCVPDELESKLEIFCLLDRMAPPRTVLATPTTRLSIADLASCTYRPDRCVAIVAEAASLAEDVRGGLLLRRTTRTSVETVEQLRRFWSRLGYSPRFELDASELP